jgi:hypothetical protein
MKTFLKTNARSIFNWALNHLTLKHSFTPFAGRNPPKPSPPATLNFPAAATEKVQKKMSAAQGVGLEEPDYPRR